MTGVATDGRVRACSLVGNAPHVLDASEQAIDRVAPARPTGVAAVQVKRGRGPAVGCAGSATASSCDDLGIITIEVEAADDRTPPDKIGYRLTLKAATLPPGLDLPTADLRPNIRSRPDLSRPDQLMLAWVDGNTDSQEPIDFTITIAAVDLAGNAGEGVDLRIANPGK